MNHLRVLIGFDEREAEAARVAAKSLREVTHGALEAEFLCLPKLVDQGLITRVSDYRGGQDYDLTSNEHTSTRFKVSRFLTPIICQQGFALFTDCDVLFLEDPRRMLEEIQAHDAVSVVQHEYIPREQWKMVGQRNANYHRKAWSSVMLFNCDHHANRRLSLRDVNERSAMSLNQFYWLHGSEIGSLDRRWNWLVDVQEQPQPVGIAHMTLGGPWLEGWKGGSIDPVWKGFAA